MPGVPPALPHGKAISFQIRIGAVTGQGRIAVREIADHGFPRGQLVLAHLRGRQLMGMREAAPPA